MMTGPRVKDHHFEAEKLQNLSKTGVTSHKVGVAEVKVGGAAAPPTE